MSESNGPDRTSPASATTREPTAGTRSSTTLVGRDLPPPEPATEAVSTAQPSERYLNRELSWLDFNERVLALAEDRTLPVLERAKFMAIFSQNLDEFFQVRVAGLKEQVRAGVTATSPDGLSPLDQLAAIRRRVEDLTGRQIDVFARELVPDLEAAGIRFIDWEDLQEDDRAFVDRVFEDRIFPVLTPLAVDPAHPFPYISNLSLNLAVVVDDPERREPRIARVKVPPLLPRFVVMPDGERFVPLEQVIATHLPALFPGMGIVDHYPFRVTRNADFDPDDDAAEDLLAAVETILQRRRRSRLAVRLEIDQGVSDQVHDLLVRELEIGPVDIYRIAGPLDFSGLWSLYRLDRPDLKFEAWTPTTDRRLVIDDGFDQMARTLRSGDVLVHHPYDSFSTSVEAFISRAADDPNVLAIKQTLYRTSGAESPIVRALIRAAEQGKQVVALVELKARFDEEANIAWARVLEEAGVHVVYGVVGLKTHAKTALVVRNEGDTIHRYGHIGTGNYNPDTAHLYEDVGILTADPKLGQDLSALFNYLTGYSREQRYRRLVVAPVAMRARLLRMVRAEADKGAEGRIVVKINNLVDTKTIDALYQASGKGARIDLMVRSICCLRPGVPGLSENIRVRSLVGRYLEHSRIFRFGEDDPTATYYIGSADLMPRNLDDRVEALVPVEDLEHRARLAEILDVCLADDTLAWELGPDGMWTKVPSERGIDAQSALQALALQRASHGSPSR
jgi:polyphosphate kinase